MGRSPQHPLSPLAHTTLYASLCWCTHSRNASRPTTELMARAAARSSPSVSRTTHSFSTGTQHPRRFSLLTKTLPQRPLPQRLMPRHVPRHVPPSTSVSRRNTLCFRWRTTPSTLLSAGEHTPATLLPQRLMPRHVPPSTSVSRHNTPCLRWRTTPSTFLSAGEHTPATLLPQRLMLRHVPRHVPPSTSVPRHNALCLRWQTTPSTLCLLVHSLPQRFSTNF